MLKNAAHLKGCEISGAAGNNNLLGNHMRKLVNKHVRATLAILLGLFIVFGTSIYIELLGWRILYNELSLSQAWNQAFLFGALRTAAGAVLLGLVAVLIGVIPHRIRAWTLTHSLWLWSVGAVVFLSAMVALVMWAP